MVINKLDNIFYYHFFNGTLNNSFDYFGSHVYKESDEIIGVEFLLYAPNANNVGVICEHNGYKEIYLKEINKGFFYLYLQGNLVGMRYKYCIHTKQHKKLYKADPFSFQGELRPNNSSIIYDLQEYNFFKKDLEEHIKKPMVIYEMHLASWKKENNNFKSYKSVVDELINYLQSNNFTHVEFLPIQEHPLDDSWGYMTTGYYAPTARHGNPEELQYLINKLQTNNIKVILDWVPGHICKDNFGLYNFDGTYLFEYESEFIRENKNWGTANLDLSKNTTKNFLISNALYWMKYFNVDGFRVDAVNNLIYYLGDKSLGVNKNAISFLQELNVVLKKQKSNIILIAEDSSAYPNVTKPINENGIGFDYKWNMGWMNDSLKYFELNSDMRKYNHNLLTFGFSYVFSENYVLAISHDEVVHLKKSLYSKMPGDYFEKFNNLKAFLGFMFTHPGKKLLFMGCEFAQDIEWNFKEELKFDLYQNEANKTLNLFYKDLSTIYLNEKIFYETEHNNESFVFIDADNNIESIFVYARVHNDEHIITILNASNESYNNHKIGVLQSGSYYEILNSDNAVYGGSNIVNDVMHTKDEKINNQSNSIEMNIAAYSVILLKYKI